MTQIKTLATYEIVQRLHPRPPPTEKDELGRAVGKAIDDALSRWSHQFGRVQGTTATAIRKYAHGLLDEGLKDADLRLTPEQLEAARGEVERVLTAFRKSEVFGLDRPRSRLVIINNQGGVYAQPDYWNGRSRFYEMKSYRAVPPPPDVALQVRVFQLAFPGLESYLACFDRHVTPVETVIVPVPLPSPAEREELLAKMLALTQAHGQTKVLEYVENPTVRYEVDPAKVPALPPAPPAPAPREAEEGAPPAPD